MVTLKDISEKVGVSVTTISRVLNHDSALQVSNATKKAIFLAANQLGYVPVKERHIKTSTPLTIGVVDWCVVPDGYHNIHTSFLTSLSKSMRLSHKLHFVRIEKDDHIHVNGLIVFGDYSEREIEHFLIQSRNIVFVKTDRLDFDFDRILIEYEPAMTLALRDMEEEIGKDIALIGGIFRHPKYTIGQRRYKKITQLMQSLKCYEPNLVRVGEYSHEGGYEMARDLFRTNQVKGLIVTSDVVAGGVLNYLKEHQDRALRSLRMTVYRDINQVDLSGFLFDEVKMYTDLVWEKAIQMLMEQIQGRTVSLQLTIPSSYEKQRDCFWQVGNQPLRKLRIQPPPTAKITAWQSVSSGS